MVTLGPMTLFSTLAFWPIKHGEISFELCCFGYEYNKRYLVRVCSARANICLNQSFWQAAIKPFLYRCSLEFTAFFNHHLESVGQLDSPRVRISFSIRYFRAHLSSFTFLM